MKKTWPSSAGAVTELPGAVEAQALGHILLLLLLLQVLIPQ